VELSEPGGNGVSSVVVPGGVTGLVLLPDGGVGVVLPDGGVGG
jgi:hypothetical protein